VRLARHFSIACVPLFQPLHFCVMPVTPSFGLRGYDESYVLMAVSHVLGACEDRSQENAGSRL
jgi:hypothetical protein